MFRPIHKIPELWYDEGRICPTPDDSNNCNVYRDMEFPQSVYDHVEEYHVEEYHVEEYHVEEYHVEEYHEERAAAEMKAS